MGSFVEMANTELEYICMLHQLSSHPTTCHRSLVQPVISVNGREDYPPLSEIYDYNGPN